MSEYIGGYIDKRVKIKNSNKPQYIKDKVVGKYGTIIKTSGGSIGVLVDGMLNTASGYGAYWFETNEIEIFEDESEDMKMKEFEYVAIVNLIEDYNKKDYGFAIYVEELKLINHSDTLVVVNARGKNNRVLGVLKDVVSTEDYYKDNKNIKITAEVVGIVNMDGYIAREEEKERLKELAKKKAAIEKELEAEINKRKSVEYYEEMAKKYSDNPKLAELVAELKELGE